MKKEQPSRQISAHRVWWKEAVIYQIYPRSFKDSDGDGIGDLQGIISRLDYVKSLGVDVIWLNPIFASPNDDNGYDISDYRRIMKEFGTMNDFDELLEGIHGRGMKLILDLVVNHSSDEHFWFRQAHKARSNPYYTYYHWWPAEQGEPPFRPSYFDENGSAWAYNKPTDSYYLHYFSKKQPDLNWENPQVRNAIYDMMKFWFDKGIDGFRMDSISMISKDTRFPEIDPAQYPDLFDFYAQGPHLHQYLHEMNQEVTGRYDCMTVGEGSGVQASDVAKFVRPDRKELNMLYHFQAAWVRNTTRPDSSRSGIDYSLLALKRMFVEWDQAVENGWPSIYLGNHDQPRMVSRFGSEDPEFRTLSAQMLATFLLTLRGTPSWYAGDELGMTNIKFDRIEEYRDIDTINRYKKMEKEGENTEIFLEEQKQIGRDNARTPFQWDASRNAGFTSGTPWLPVHPNYKEVNVASEETDPHSALNYFRRTIAFRKAHPDLIYGPFRLVDANNIQVFGYTRGIHPARYLILLNFSSLTAESKPGIDLKNAELVLHNYPDTKVIREGETIRLKPFEALVYRLDS